MSQVAPCVKTLHLLKLFEMRNPPRPDLAPHAALPMFCLACFLLQH